MVIQLYGDENYYLNGKKNSYIPDVYHTVCLPLILANVPYINCNATTIY